jgi:hypothetical protein
MAWYTDQTSSHWDLWIGGSSVNTKGQDRKATRHAQDPRGLLSIVTSCA